MGSVVAGLGAPVMAEGTDMVGGGEFSQAHTDHFSVFFFFFFSLYVHPLRIKFICMHMDRCLIWLNNQMGCGPWLVLSSIDNLY